MPTDFLNIVALSCVLALICIVILLLAAALFVLRACLRLLAADKEPLAPQSQPVAVHGVNKEVTYTLTPLPVQASVKVEHLPAPLENLSSAEQDRVVPVQLVRKPQASRVGEKIDSLECGSCGQEIRSGCVETVKAEGTGEETMIFECEHCREKVGVPV
jgi:hypothetical protein